MAFGRQRLLPPKPRKQEKVTILPLFLIFFFLSEEQIVPIFNDKKSFRDESTSKKSRHKPSA